MKMLAAIDESKFSEAALKAVIDQFDPRRTDVRVIHVVEPIAFSVPPQMAADYTPELGGEVKKAEGLLERSAKTARCRLHGRYGNR